MLAILYPGLTSLVLVTATYSIVSRRAARLSVDADLQMVGHFDQLLKQLETKLLREAKLHDPKACSFLRTIPGIGKILSLVLLYEIHSIERFPSVGDFLSYARLVTPKRCCPAVLYATQFEIEGGKQFVDGARFAHFI
jgi:transposase